MGGNIFGISEENPINYTEFGQERLKINNPIDALYRSYGLTKPSYSATNKVFNNTNSNIGVLAPLSETDRLYNLRQKELDILKNASDYSMNMDIAGSTLGGITGLTNLGLSIWGAIESNKNLTKQREVADKQIALAEEQIQASKQYRDERAKEIARLNRVRSNTTKAFNTGSVITRSY